MTEQDKVAPIREVHGFLPDYKCRICKQLIVSIPIEVIFTDHIKKDLTDKFGKCKKCGSYVNWYVTLSEMEGK